MKKLVFLVCFFCVVSSVCSDTLLTEIARQTIKAYFLCPSINIQEFSKRFNSRISNGPIFVTLSKNGQTRTCWGALEPQSKNIAEGVVLATLDALSRDYAHSPIRREEIEDLKVQITVIRNLIPVKSFREINPVHDGLMVRSGNRSGVILPGEAKDSYYALVQARLKASLRQNDSYQIYRIKADVYRQ